MNFASVPGTARLPSSASCTRPISLAASSSSASACARCGKNRAVLPRDELGRPRAPRQVTNLRRGRLQGVVGTHIDVDDAVHVLGCELALPPLRGIAAAPRRVAQGPRIGTLLVDRIELCEEGPPV